MVPRPLRIWFVVHFVADIVFAVPLVFFPGVFLGLFGWTTVDPVTSRVVGAALIGIGGESLLGRDANLESFRTMLRLKILWSGAAVFGFVLSLVQSAPWGTWLFLGIFAGFSGLWMYWARRLSVIAAKRPEESS
jgi:hypothetical protein